MATPRMGTPTRERNGRDRKVGQECRPRVTFRLAKHLLATGLKTDRVDQTVQRFDKNLPAAGRDPDWLPDPADCVSPNGSGRRIETPSNWRGTLQMRKSQCVGWEGRN